jgi:hypothetical protein
MQELTLDEVNAVAGGDVFTKTGDLLAALAVPAIAAGPEATATFLIAAGVMYVASGVFG